MHFCEVTSYPMFIIGIKRFCYFFIAECTGEATRHFISFLSSFDRKIIADTGNPDNPESYEGGEVDAKSQSRHTGVG